MSTRNLGLGLLLLVALINLSCGNEEELTLPSSSTPITPPTTTTSSYFEVSLGSTYSHHVRTTTDFNQLCRISSTATTNESLDCIIDVNEADLGFQGVSFKYEVPKNMCTYMRQTPYWYYNYETGVGPSSIVIDKTVDASGATTLYQCTIDGVGPGVCSNSELVINSSDDTMTCAYNHTALEGPNCCLGSYTRILNLTTPSGTTTSTTNAKWGGKVKDCIGGAAKTNWSTFSRSDVPLSLVYSAINGLSGSYSVAAPQTTVQDGTSWPIANFFTTTGSPHLHTGFVDLVTTSTAPYFIEPIDDRSGTPMISFSNLAPPGSRYYRFECLDEAYEVIHSLKVQIRDWDELSEYLSYIASSGVSGTPDSIPGGGEGTDCDGIGTGAACNDFYDLDDFLNVIYGGGPYSTAIPANRGQLFPAQKY